MVNTLFFFRNVLEECVRANIVYYANKISTLNQASELIRHHKRLPKG